MNRNSRDLEKTHHHDTGTQCRKFRTEQIFPHITQTIDSLLMMTAYINEVNSNLIGLVKFRVTVITCSFSE